MSKAIDDIAFATAKGSAKSGGTVVDVGSTVLKHSNKFDPMSVLKNVDGASFFKNIGIPELPIRTSKLFHTGGALKNLKKVDLDALIPKKTSDILTSVSKSADDVVISSTDDIASSLKRIDLGDATAISSVANKSAFTKLKDISQQITKLSKKNVGSLANKKTLDAKAIDDVADVNVFKNTDEMTDSLKQSSGLSKSVDDIAENGGDAAKTAKNLETGQIDDIADQAKNGKLGKALDFAKRHETALSMSIVGAFMVSEFVNGNLKFGNGGVGDDEEVLEEEIADPGESNEETQISEAGNSVDVQQTDESEADNKLASNGVIIGVIAAGMASMAL